MGFLFTFLGAIRSRERDWRCVFSYRYNGWEGKCSAAKWKMRERCPRRKDKERARPPGYSWRTRFCLRWTHRRRPSREKPVISRRVRRRRRVPPARRSRNKKKGGTIKSGPGRTIPRRETWRRLFPWWEVFAIPVLATPIHGLSFLNFDSEMIINMYRDAINTCLHRERINAWRSISLFDNFSKIISTETREMVLSFVLRWSLFLLKRFVISFIK